MAVETTYIMLKPDAVQRGLMGEILSMIEKKFQIVGMKFLLPTEELASAHYAEHSAKPFFGELVNFLTSSPVLAMAIRGPNAVSEMRRMMGATKPEASDIGTIRQKYAVTMGFNIIHGSDSVESAHRELSLWFSPEEIVEWTRDSDQWTQ